MIAVGFARTAANGFERRAGPAGGARAGRRRRADPLPGPAGLQLRLRGDDRGRGDLGRRAGLQAAGVEERPHDADRDDRDPGRDLRRHHLPGPPVRHLSRWRPTRPATRRSSPRSPGTSSAATTPAYYYIQFATMAILVLAANTAYSDFPRLSYFLARDRFMPRQFTFRGDRLAFTTGIVTLGLLAGIVLVDLRRRIERLIPLYAVGVFTAFTLSQSGMVMRWRTAARAGLARRAGSSTWSARSRPASWRSWSRSTKFQAGAWMIVGRDLAADPDDARDPPPLHERPTRAGRRRRRSTRPRSQHTVIVPIASVNRVARQTLAYARSHLRQRDGGPRHRRRGRDRADPAASGRRWGCRRAAGASSSRRTARWSGRCWPTSTRSTSSGRTTR